MENRITFLIIIFLATLAVIECGEYHMVNDTKYFISYPTKYNWYQAQRYCTYYNMHLVSIHSFEENEDVLDVLKRFEVKNNIPGSNGVYFYTSGTDAGHNVNEFFWTATGLPMIFTNWINAQIPDNTSNKFNSTDDCLLLNGDHFYKWDDINCYDRHYLICQDKISLMAKPADAINKDDK